jgi:hypothetical protein
VVLVVRCSFIGVWVGIVPGIGSQVVDWLAYAYLTGGGRALDSRLNIFPVCHARPDEEPGESGMPGETALAEN